ncbi:DNA-directed DNA polymerase II small subunit [Methanolobus chelungpuianus]|uniref:DNA polymerase II small subunit n=1 Tax=Methanolobus chelungpuianus TaxID=502115 RepID=A0AAE3HD48_9EURY|nr:DNA-directed DNA polymerase II small subunit [Methanolobus chelungpuianus]MCQ6963880.1 DNA polymerase II [Methanolobus chelungpuianus]
MKQADVLTAFIEEGYQISPEAVELICAHCSPRELVSHVLRTIDMSVLVIGIEHIDLESFAPDKYRLDKLQPDKPGKPDNPNILTLQSSAPISSVLVSDPEPLPLGPVLSCSPSGYSVPLRSRDPGAAVRHPGNNPVTVLSDISDNSTCVGEYMEFVQYFRNRYSRLSDIIRSRVNARPIESLKKSRSAASSVNRRGNGEQSELSIIGMISDIKSTSNGHKVLEVEDPTGIFSVLVRTADKELFEQAMHLVLDEVVGFTGTLTNDGKLMIAQKIILPDLPNTMSRKSGTHGKAVLTSDVHIGSSTFLEEPWEHFIDFLKGNTDNEALAGISREVRYLLVAGDLVDGVGIYPGQEKELNIEDIYDQYRRAAEYFDEVPKHISIVISPGNHDAVRQAEPQPKLPERIRADFPENVTFVGNPAMVDLDGARVLLYHGRSIDDLVASVPGVSYHAPTKGMVEMMKFRHLSPIYGSRVSIAPEKQDHFVLNQVPDILHCGHVHTLGVEWYKNVLLINSGTWQSQTEFQKRMNVVPTPAQVPVVDLSTFKTTILKFDD